MYWPGTTFATRAEAEDALVRYIDGRYNPRRIQAGLGGLSADEYEDTYHHAQWHDDHSERGLRRIGEAHAIIRGSVS